MAKTSASRAAAEKYPSIFQHSLVCLWEEDISALRELLRQWTSRKVPDLRAYLHAHPGLVRKGVRAIRVVDVNEATIQLYEAKSKAELLGALDSTLDPAALADFVELFVAIVEGRTRVEQESTARTLTGKKLNLLVRTSIPAPRDAYQFAVVNVVDFTEYMQLERKLKEERSIVRAVIDSVPDLIFVKDKEGRFTLANQQVALRAGQPSPDTMIGKTDCDFFPREIADSYRANDREIISTGVARQNVEEEIISAAGAHSWLLTTKVPLVDADGKVTGVVGVSRDITYLKEAQDALTFSEKSYRSLVEDIGVGIISADPTGIITFTNAMVGEIFGLPRGFSLGKRIKDFLTEEEWARVRTHIGQRKTGDRSSYEINVTRADGDKRRVHVTGMSQFDAQGNYIGNFATLLDVTDRYRAEQELVRQKALVQALMDNVPDYIYFKDRDSRFILNNQAHAEALGAHNPAEMLGKTDFDYFTPVHAQKAFDDEQRIIRTGQPMIDEVEEQTWKDRPPTWASSTKMALRNEKGEIIGTFGVSRDMTERRKMEEKNIRLAAMIESSNDAIVGIGLDDVVTSWNNGAEKIFGYTAEEMIGKSINPLLTPQITDQKPMLREKLQKEGHVVQMGSTVTRKDGKPIYVSTTISFVTDAERRIVGIACISRDMTSERTLQAQILRAQRLESLGILAAGIAHQFNNINTAVKGYLDFLAHDPSLPGGARSSVQEALKAVQRAVDITDRLQGLTNTSPASQETLNLDEAVPSMLLLFGERLEKEGIRLSVDIPQTPPVRVSHAMLEFIIASLITNSIQALIGCPSPSIAVRGRSEADFCCLEVRDTGCGISPENLPRIFTPFFTTKGEWAEPGSSQASVKGIGLSLAVCQSTVADSGGWIEVESSPESETTFRVWLPVAQPESDA
ncbi:MAG TPA: PAS domain S-box protein [Spirochaetia bacterium]|nr:PAS domain S-box protein [Spirochaetia bacterium]